MNQFRKAVCIWLDLLPREQVDRLLHQAREDERGLSRHGEQPAERQVRALIRRFTRVCADGRRSAAVMRFGVCVDVPREWVVVGDTACRDYVALRVAEVIEQKIREPGKLH